jgi:hypothetical protein
MTDIVKRLRRHVSRLEMDDDDQVALVPRWEVNEAADEIERLRAEVKALRLPALRMEHEAGRAARLEVDCFDLRAELAECKGKLLRVADFIRYHANSDGGLLAEIDAALKEKP